ncbi:hypothetical protein H9L39_08343 [Fusarium oxysporum f. sp. albedinis]|nr:hypothetical protein H9L39_08343 [Fusarium oxysporum f. sp. albedinis]
MSYACPVFERNRILTPRTHQIECKAVGTRVQHYYIYSLPRMNAQEGVIGGLALQLFLLQAQTFALIHDKTSNSQMHRNLRQH